MSPSVAAGLLRGAISAQVLPQEPGMEVCWSASASRAHRVCATLGCGRQTVSSRAKLCRPCFLDSARTNSLKRRRWRGGGGVAGNKGNATVGQTKRSSGQRSGTKRSAKYALVVRKRWLDKILDGDKDWEIRSCRTSRRGWVFLAQSGATGQLLGRARLVDCFQLSAEMFEANAHRHCVDSWRSVTYKGPFVWVLEQAERFEKPFDYEHRPGAVVWVRAG